jgi:hypothetical protein
MVTLSRALAIGAAAAAALTLGGCYNDGYGYGGVSAGIGSGGYYGGGYDPYYGGGFGYPAYGWFDNFYYPGNGYYVYDRGGRRFPMRDRDRQHWHSRGGDRQAGNWRGPGGAPPPGVRGPDRRGDGGPRGDGRWRGNPGGSRPGGAAGVNPGAANPGGAPGTNPQANSRWQQGRGGALQNWAQRREAMRQGPQTQQGQASAAPRRFERPQGAPSRGFGMRGGQGRRGGGGGDGPR